MNELGILYITGMPRSGSTLLGRLLADRFKVQFAGELLHLDALCRPAERCGCGSDLKTCTYWGPVRALLANLNPRATRTVLRAAATASPASSAPSAAGAKLVAEVVERLLTSTSYPIVDTSKIPGLALAHQANASRRPVHAVHLLRDPSAVIASIAERPLRKRERDDPAARLRTFSPLAAGLRWRKHNWLASQLRHEVASYQTVHLEDLVREPDGVLDDIGQSAGLHRRSNGQPLDHSLRGNPSRFDPLVVRPALARRATSTSRHDGPRLIALAGRTWGYSLVERR